MIHKAKKNIALILLTYLFCVFTAPYLLSALSENHSVKNELIIHSANQSGDATSEVRELEEIIDLEEDENVLSEGLMDKISAIAFIYYSEKLNGEKEISSSANLSVPIYILNRNLRN